MPAPLPTSSEWTVGTARDGNRKNTVTPLSPFAPKHKKIKIKRKEIFGSRMIIVPIFQKKAFDFIDRHHRHHKKPVGSVFQLAVAEDSDIHGVCVVGRPVARHLQDGFTLEVTRLCTTGEKNACSMLYSAAWRVAKNMGYRRLITYILSDEPGTSLKAAGWKLIGERGGGSWNAPSRSRVDKHPLQSKLLFEASIL